MSIKNISFFLILLYVTSNAQTIAPFRHGNEMGIGQGVKRKFDKKCQTMLNMSATGNEMGVNAFERWNAFEQWNACTCSAPHEILNSFEFGQDQRRNNANQAKKQKTTTAEEAALAALQNSGSLKDRKKHIEILANLCTTEYGLRNYDNVIKFARQLLHNLPAKSTKTKAKAFYLMALASKGKDDYENALFYFKHAAKIYKSIQNAEGECRIYYSLAGYYIEIDDYANALIQIDKSLEVSEDVSYDPMITRILLTRKGAILYKLKNYDAALAVLNEAKNTEDNYGVQKDIIYAEIALVQYELKYYHDAIATALKVIHVDRDEGVAGPEAQVKALLAIGKTYFKLNNVQKAKRNLYKAYGIAKSSSNAEAETNAADCALLLSTLESGNRNYKKALALALEYNAYTLGIAKKARDIQLKRVVNRYELEEKRREIATLRLNKNRNDMLLSKTEYRLQVTFIALVFSALVLSLLYFFLNLNKRKNKILAHKNRVIAFKNIQLENAKRELENRIVQKRLLLKEVHHRVKNNLQLVISLLNLQSREINNQKVNDFLESGTGRIVSMALIHENLYQRENLKFITINEYTENLVKNIIDSLADKRSVNYELKIAALNLPVQTAVPLGLIMNELIVNTVKHNYNPEKILFFSIHIQLSGGKTNFTYFDPQNKGTADPVIGKPTFGMQLVHLLARQLKGEIRISYDKGLLLQIDF